jgi:hypothetical protein
MIEKVVSITELGDPAARKMDRDYWLSRPPSERTDAVAFLRLQVHGITEGLQRIACVVQRERR